MKTRKPFSLDLWNKLGDKCKVFVECGDHVNELVLLKDTNTTLLVGLIYGSVYSWSTTGKLMSGASKFPVGTKFDLELEYESTKLTKWVNIYSNYTTSLMYSTEKAAQESPYNKHNRIACVPVEIEYYEGENM